MLQDGKILFVGHDYHRKTGSSAFFRHLLSELGQVEEIFDDSYLPSGKRRDYRSHVLKHRYALVVVWQIEYAAQQLAGLPNVLFVPMFDSCRELPVEFWRRLNGMRVLAFSIEVYHRAQKGGCQARYVQYWPGAETVKSPIVRQPERAHYWYRRNDLGLSRLAWICRSLGITELVIHHHPDPVVTDPIPRHVFVERLSATVRFTDWQEERYGLAEELAGAACSIASRPYEGIGMAFLEAMAAGCCVVAPRNPTYTDYIVSGVNGLLYDPACSRALPAGRLVDLGHMAAQWARRGRERWLASIPDLRDWLTSSAGKGILLPRPSQLDRKAQPGTASPRVSVITVVRNAARDLETTIASVAAQRGIAFEYIVVDGASEDDTVEVVRAHAAQIDTFVSRPDNGIYDAMNKSLALARGEFVLFMNAGDSFVSADSLADLMQADTDDFDIVTGHHIYCRADGTESLHRVNNFSDSLNVLRQGWLSNDWELGMPCHQATATRRKLLQELGYDTRLRIAADRDFLFRAAAAGARFKVSDSYVARYQAGGFSQRNVLDCVIEWQSMAERHTPFAQKVRKFYAMRLLDGFDKSLAASPSPVTALRLAWHHRSELITALALSNHQVVARYLWNKASARLVQGSENRWPRTFHVTAQRPPRGLVLHGFSYPETAGTWTERADVEMIFAQLPAGCRAVELHVASIDSQLAGVPVTIQANDRQVAQIILRRGRNSLSLPEPMKLANLRLSMPPTLSPRDLGRGNDDRSLGVMLSRVVIR